MASNFANNKRIAKNTAFLYVRLLLTMAISLYTSRIILNTLGVDDYGLYNVIGGFVTMFALLTDSLGSATSRFLTVSLAETDLENQRKVFSTNVSILLGLAVIIFVSCELLAYWYFATGLNVPEARRGVVNIVFQLSLMMFLVNIVRVAFTSMLFAHEHSKAFAIFSIIDALMKLAAALLITMGSYDKLILYTSLMLFTTIVSTVLIGAYCQHHFQEFHLSMKTDRTLLRQMLDFSGWSLVGYTSRIAKGQGVTLLINNFFGVGVNAARGIATQVDGATQQLVNNVSIAVNPQIIKSYVNGDISYMHRLVFFTSKSLCFITLLYAVPLTIEADTVLGLWLGIVPDYAVIFTQLTLVSSFILVIARPFETAIQANGRIRSLQVSVSIVSLMELPVAYTLYKIGFPPEFSYITLIAINVIIVFAHVLIARKKVQVSIRRFMYNVFLPVMGVGALTYILSSMVSVMIGNPYWRLAITILDSTLFTLLLAYSVGLNTIERDIVKSLAIGIVAKFLPKFKK